MSTIIAQSFGRKMDSTKEGVLPLFFHAASLKLLVNELFFSIEKVEVPNKCIWLLPMFLKLADSSLMTIDRRIP